MVEATEFVLLLTLGLLVTAGLAPVVRWLMLRHGVVDIPNHRSSHVVPIPRGGGIACLAGLVVMAAVAAVRGSEVPWLSVTACVVLAVLGFTDDWRTLPPVPRLAVQSLAGACVGYQVGGFAGLAAGVVFSVSVVNVTNFMDGINGITSLTMTLWGLTALAVGLHDDVAALAFLGAAAAGPALGFLPWNAPRARLFLGDSGSYLFGCLAAMGLLVAWASPAPFTIVAAPLSMYAVDTVSVLVRRLLRGDPVMQAHREHAYQRLVSEAGMSHAAVSVVVVAAAGAVTALWASLPVILSIPSTALVAGCYLAGPTLARQLRGRRGLTHEN